MRLPLRISAVFAAFTLSVVFLSAPMAEADSNDCSISLQPSEPSPQLVGELIVWTATAANCGDMPIYQFSVAGGTSDGEREASRRWNNHPFQMVRDFSRDTTFRWAPIQEGLYEVMVRVKDGFDSQDATSAVVSDIVNSRVTETEAVVTPTLNPLVALYSARPCADGSIYVRFRPARSNNPAWMRTNALPCVPGLSRNFLVAGMLANRTYEMAHVTREESSSSPLLFTTGMPPPTLNIPDFTVRQLPGPDSDLSQNTIYHDLAGRAAPNDVNLLATDLLGRVKWYCDPLQAGLVAIGSPGSSLVPSGTVLLAGRDRYRTLGLNVLREIDLAGNPLRETNIDAVNAQLRAGRREIIYGFHHETRRLANGDTATLGWTLRTIDVNGTPTDYAGDLLLVLDQNLQVVWTWDAFDHLDVNRGPILGDVCTGAPCPLPGAVDWLHENAIAESVTDGNLLISVRHQAWVIKIDYANGNGDGHIIWRLGKDGDFAADSTDPDPWFSYQHNPHYLNRSTLVLFDNGNTRRPDDPDAHSRGQVWRLDEETMMATPVLNADLGNYSDSLGSAERLPNRNFVFTSGSQGQAPDQFGQLIEILPDGTPTFVLEVAAREYRSYRVNGLYNGVRP